MATKKKTKTKAKKTKKKASARKTAPKKVARRSASKKAAPKKGAAKARKPKAAGGVAKQVKTTPSQPPLPTPPAGERIGVVTHYFNHLSVAIINIEAGILREGETVQIKGHTTDFMQPVESMEIDHIHVSEAVPGQSVGLRVKSHAREHDVVYKVAH